MYHIIQILKNGTQEVHLGKNRKKREKTKYIKGNKFFVFFKKSAEITGMNESLIKRLYIILQVLASGENINPEKFAKETANLFIDLYGQYYMSASIHKIRMHGADVIKSFIFPIGNLSEEAAEARNRHFRQYRQFHARKCNRKCTNEEILHNFLLSSDPSISTLRLKCDNNKSRVMVEEALFLLSS